MTCAHLNFQASVGVNRLTEEDEVTVKGYSADVRIKCVDCNLDFRFIHRLAGSKRDDPTVSADGLELRCPLEPAYVTEILGIPLISGHA